MDDATRGLKALIENHFSGRVGRFLEVGANDGATDSLTAGLIDAGWQGTMVEANPVAFARLMANRGGNGRLTLVCAAVVPDADDGARGVVKFWPEENGGQVSTVSAAHRDAFIASRGARFALPILVASIQPWLLAGLADGCLGDLAIFDAEGVSRLLAGEFLECVQPEVVVVECDADGPEPIEAMMAEKYRTERHGCNVVGFRK